MLLTSSGERMPNSLSHQGAVLGSVVSSSVALWRGCVVVRAAQQPALPLTLYDMEACPFCRLVREALSALHLDVQVRPCPRGGTRFRPEAQRLGGKQLFPLLVDPNTGTTMYESKDIVAYLFRTYGGGDVPAMYQRSWLRPVLGSLQSGVRLGHGSSARPSQAANEPLRLWSFEGSPFSRLVRERLTELELPYTLYNLGKEHWKEAGPAVRRILPNPYVPREGGKRHAFWQAHGRVQVPYLEDPNTAAKLFNSPKILDYLERTYAA
jgi:glutathione S-transferase